MSAPVCDCYASDSAEPCCAALDSKSGLACTRRPHGPEQPHVACAESPRGVRIHAIAIWGGNAEVTT